MRPAAENKGDALPFRDMGTRPVIDSKVRVRSRAGQADCRRHACRDAQMKVQTARAALPGNGHGAVFGHHCAFSGLQISEARLNPQAAFPDRAFGPDAKHVCTQKVARKTAIDVGA